MMNVFGKYILSVTAVCICCSLVRTLVGEKSGASGIIQPLCGVVIAITIISPVIKIRAADIRTYTGVIQADADIFVQQGIDMSAEELRTNIIESSKAYILEKASLYDCSVKQLEVELSADSVPAPISVVISGTFAPSNKNRLSEDIESNMGIPKEKQRWIYQN